MGSYSFSQLPIISTTTNSNIAFSASSVNITNANAADFSGMINRLTTSSFYISRLNGDRKFGWYARGY